MSRPLSVAVLFDRLGPYHHARLDAAAAVLKVTGIEMHHVDSVYAWSPYEEAPSFQKISLFDNEADHRGTGLLVPRLFDALDAAQPDAVAVHGWVDKGALAALSWCIRNRVPAIVMSESTAWDYPRRFWKEAVKKQIIGMFSAGFAGGQPHRDYLVELGMAPDVIFTGYDTVDNDYFFSSAESTRRNADAIRAELGVSASFFLASCRFVEQKNLFRLLEAFARYRSQVGSKAWDLVLLGNGPLRPDVIQACSRHGLDGHVMLPGFCQYEELPRYYGLANAFVHASVREPWGLVVNEAMASGLPVIVSNRCGCASDLVRHGDNGFVFDPWSDAELTQRLVDLSQDPERCRKMGEASRRIMQEWSPAKFGRSLLAAANAAIAAGPATPTLAQRIVLRVLASRNDLVPHRDGKSADPK